jgi:hypothetical protein
MESIMETLERGDIFFLFRPAVGVDNPSRLTDVQRFFIVLKPDGRKVFRLLVVGRKRLPEARAHERFWGFVDRVERSADALATGLRAFDYPTETRGRRHEPAVRPAGEGAYAIALLDGQMHLSYVLEQPRQPADVQRAFRIAPEASFALSIKNPEASSPPGLGLGARERTEFPEELQQQFRDRRFEREDARLLDYAGAEFILVGARNDPQRAYGTTLGNDHADVFRELHLAKSQHPVKPLFEGQWQ